MMLKIYKKKLKIKTPQILKRKEFTAFLSANKYVLKKTFLFDFVLNLLVFEL